MRAQEYLKIRKYIKSICMDNLLELCEKVGLNDFETKLMVYTNRNETRVHTSIDLGVCESTVSKTKHKIFQRIRDYLKRNNIPY